MTRARSLSRLANSNAFTVDTNLNVGIGSTTPDVKLEVGGNMEVSGVLTATSASVSGSVTATNVSVSSSVTAATFYGDGSSLSGIAVTTNVRSDTLVVTGVSTLGITTGITALGVSGNVHATKYIGDGSGLTGLNVPAGFNELDAALFN